MRLLKLFSVLLDYPRDELWQHGAELLAAAADPVLSPARRQALGELVRQLLATDCLSAQERWLGLFERGRAMSLLLFEHVHGESRDRGQAMVDLLNTYRQQGLELATRELPDYLPVVLEYLAGRPAEEVVEWLQHTGPILGLLASRAADRGSPHALLFEVLVELGQQPIDYAGLRQRVASEERDDTPEAMDRAWQAELS